jgi:hypothetical protein
LGKGKLRRTKVGKGFDDEEHFASSQSSFSSEAKNIKVERSQLDLKEMAKCKWENNCLEMNKCRKKIWRLIEGHINFCLLNLSVKNEIVEGKSPRVLVDE